jgi:hypothetical protein
VGNLSPFTKCKKQSMMVQLGRCCVFSHIPPEQDHSSSERYEWNILPVLTFRTYEVQTKDLRSFRCGMPGSSRHANLFIPVLNCWATGTKILNEMSLHSANIDP